MPLAEQLLGADTVAALADRLTAALGGGRSAGATRRAAVALDGLGFSARVAAVRDAVLEDLPDRYRETERVLRAALEDPEFTGWMTFPVNEAVAVRGTAAPDAFEPALELLAALTPRLTAESAVRPFLRSDLRRALRLMTPWTGHADEHVRRLVSEGTRPRLPWAPRLTELVTDPSPALPLLDALHRDPSDYVRRSVANHLNDISRDHPAVAVATAARWLRQDGTTERLVRRGLRTLVKAGDPRALTLLGHSPDAPVDVTGPALHSTEIRIGDQLVFDCAVTNTGDRPTSVVVDYVVHHMKANGTRTPKVFKLTTRALAPGERWTATRRHSFRPITTRRYHEGVHLVRLQVNGVPRGEEVPFLLKPGP
ncbi:DNA alkylation repair protein [Streptomyces sp. MUM 203J]|uniref:DNA alkylation repair protein n=1 Tax=Streptomyces sp. MUM 203J TaxID=2791990 RepID=UPI001F036A3A|nr:DNA alkylation repair protein [Streptomyces sp. MUM 203J]MCH0542867.1 DNA alkylation repair protein [Streptomyces sp. MUM 203J]